MRTLARLWPTFIGLALTILFSSTQAAAQDASQRADTLDKYEPQAAQSVEVTIDSHILKIAADTIPDKDPDARAAKALLSGLKGVYVRAFEFDREGVYQPAEVEALRARFSGPEWSRVVGVRSRKFDKVDVFLSAAGQQINGIVVVASGPRKLVYVNVAGPINLEQLRDLEGRFRIPKLDLYVETKE
ncbi:MAG TPA: DUF4252 domain-containing protein [Pyrinomonadaceae bacterium]|nr:DUF4252 domain-containing protein [Pyrinomonadaceae bacterium]